MRKHYLLCLLLGFWAMCAFAGAQEQDPSQCPKANRAP